MLVAVLTLTRLIKSVVTGQAPVTPERKEERKDIPGKEQKQHKSGTRTTTPTSARNIKRMGCRVGRY